MSDMDPIAAARALIEPLTGYTPRPWSHHKCPCGHRACNQHTISTQGGVGFQAEDARLITASPDLRDMVAILADALEAERAEVAAAYEAAAQAVRAVLTNSPTGEWGAEGISMSRAIERAIHALVASDAQAALDKLLAEARLEGWRAGRDVAADEAATYDCSEGSDDFTIGIQTGYRDAVRQIVEGIREVPEPKEAIHE